MLSYKHQDLRLTKGGIMTAELVGRKKECRKLERCMKEGTAQLVVVTGRLRVGKTFLVDTFFRVATRSRFPASRTLPWSKA